MQLLIFGFKDCLLGDKIFKKNQRPAKKKNPKNYKQETPPQTPSFSPSHLQLSLARYPRVSVLCLPLSLLDIFVLKPKHQLTAEAKSKANG